MLRIRFFEPTDAEEETTAPTRVRIRTMPWEGPIKGFAINYIQRTLPLFLNRCEPDDLLQEAWVVYHKVTTAYPHITRPSHVMALFKSALRNHFINYNKKLQRFPDYIEVVYSAAALEAECDAVELLESPTTGLEEAEEHLFHDLAPEPVRRLIDQLVDGDVTPRYQWDGRVRETTEDFLTRVAKCEPGTPVVEMVLRYVDGLKPQEIS